MTEAGRLFSKTIVKKLAEEYFFLQRNKWWRETWEGNVPEASRSQGLPEDTRKGDICADLLLSSRSV